ncbi:MAG: polyribonucleotide nucleotidyltransferase [Pseudomonas sp.]|uniref:polyribonucleotide nucleotidyltransferase n=1 Tax=Pseudomonas sp. TaxID=306 RepID=UPI0027377896|nr:polyribonucleotide nucleotidyltransferase [Pseudomonas sp.]MDP3847512.1 polyribonucleotide nucleotidyltransferase [Pseudomonas sp.]
MRSQFRVIGAVLAISLFTQLAACGTLFFPDRRGQIEGKVDPVVAGLNAIGILFYVLPGLIAFGIDFATGAIYLPDAKYSIAPQRLQDAIGSDGKVDNAKLKAIIQHETGLNLPLDNPQLIQQRGNLQQLAALGLAPNAA